MGFQFNSTSREINDSCFRKDTFKKNFNYVQQIQEKRMYNNKNMNVANNNMLEPKTNVKLGGGGAV
jgi:hypothetical protein